MSSLILFMFVQGLLFCLTLFSREEKQLERFSLSSRRHLMSFPNVTHIEQMFVAIRAASDGPGPERGIQIVFIDVFIRQILVPDG